MALGHGAKIVKDGLVFAYDMGSVRSYNGPQTTNSATGITAVYNTKTALFTMFPTYEDVYVPQIGRFQQCLAMTMYNDYNGGSGNCCPSPITYYTGSGTTTNVKPSTLYTYSIVYKSENGYTHPNFMYRYEYNSSGTYLTEGGIHSTGNRLHLGDNWYWAWGTFTTQTTTARITPRCFQYQYAAWNKLYLAKVMLIEGNYTGLHPKFWPDLGETVSNTNSILDSTGNSTITANSLTYNSDGTFSFDGTTQDNRMTVTAGSQLNALKGSSNITVEAWVKYSSYSGGAESYSVITCWGSPWVWLLENPSNILRFRIHAGGSDVNIADTEVHMLNTWYHVVGTYDGATKKIYVNGVLKNSSASTGVLGSPSSSPMIGSYQGTNYCMSGDISAVKVYNKALTAAEVKQNFNALRGRFGL